MANLEDFQSSFEDFLQSINNQQYEFQLVDDPAQNAVEIIANPQFKQSIPDQGLVKKIDNLYKIQSKFPSEINFLSLVEPLPQNKEDLPEELSQDIEQLLNGTLEKKKSISEIKSPKETQEKLKINMKLINYLMYSLAVINTNKRVLPSDRQKDEMESTLKSFVDILIPKQNEQFSDDLADISFEKLKSVFLNKLNEFV